MGSMSTTNRTIVSILAAENILVRLPGIDFTAIYKDFMVQENQRE